MAGSVQTIDESISAYDGDLKERMVVLRAGAFETIPKRTSQDWKRLLPPNQSCDFLL